MKKFISVCALCSLTLLSCVNIIAAKKDVNTLDIRAVTNSAKQKTWYPTCESSTQKLDTKDTPVWVYQGRDDTTQVFFDNTPTHPIIRATFVAENNDKRNGKKYTSLYLTYKNTTPGHFDHVAIGDIYPDYPNPTVYWHSSADRNSTWFPSTTDSVVPSLADFERSLGLDRAPKQKNRSK